jgi:hypothetical protein
MIDAKMLQQIALPGRLPFIRLICQHSEYLKFDIDAFPPSEREMKLVPVWHFQILRALPDLDSKRLFDRMLAIHRCKEFVPTPADSTSLSWTQQCLLQIGQEARTTSTDDLLFSRKGTNIF